MSEKICLPDQGTVTACAQYSVVVGYVCVCVYLLMGSLTSTRTVNNRAKERQGCR